MLNLLTSAQTREADAHTINNRNISSLELMETASVAFADEFKKEIPDKSTPISIYCGSGNNGGDGLAIARILSQDGYKNLEVKVLQFPKFTSDFEANLKRLIIPFIILDPANPLEDETSDIIIDALLGSGLNRQPEGLLKQVIKHINKSDKKVISVDVPSGFPSEGIINTDGTMINACLTISFQRPKINFFFPESVIALDRFKVRAIGLDEEYIQSTDSYWKLIEDTDIRCTLKSRKSFSHKGTYGHALIIAGKKETMGAALLSADACLHTGAGLTTACIPESGLNALNTRSPEIMALIRDKSLSGNIFTRYSSIAFGPGTGTDDEARQVLKEVLSSKNIPLVLDADALTLLSENEALLKKLPPNTILTPHLKEFDRLFGPHSSWWDRIETARKKAKELNIIILLKNQYSFIILPDENVLINPTGNPAMAVGGMGDVLTGMIAAFLAQGYSSQDATMIACYLHGKAGDELHKEGMHNIPPRYLIQKLPFILNEYS